MVQQAIRGSTQIMANTVTSGQVNTSILVAGGGNPLTANWGLGGYLLNNLGTPAVATDAATKGYVDSVAQGLNLKLSAVAATTGSETTITISSGNVTTISGTTLDGVSPAVNDYVLVKDAPAATGGGSAGSTQPGNGLYQVTSNTTNLSVSRAADMAASNSPLGGFCFIEGGTVNASSGWVVSSPAPDTGAFTYGTTAMKWTQFSGAGEVTTGNVLTKSANQISVNTMATNTIVAGNAGTPTITTLSGDATLGATGAVTIAASAVTLGKMANLSANSVIGNNTAGSTTPVAVPLAVAAGTPAASTIPLWDANKTLAANCFVKAVTSTATAGGTTNLTIATAAGVMIWTGSSTQTVTLPTTSVPQGAQYTFVNQSSAALTVQSSGSGGITVLSGMGSAPYNACTCTALVAAPTTAANWAYVLYSTGGGGSVTAVSVATANGFSGSSSGGATPALTLTSNVTAGLLASSGAGGSIQAATGANICAHLSTRETPTGTINGSTTVFTLANTPVSGTEMVFQNGLLQRAGGTDYSISTNSITFITAPATGDNLMVTYWY